MSHVPAASLPPASVTVALCTFRRASVADTLRSLVGQAPEGVTLSVVVADNDDTPSARAVVEKTAAEAGLSCHYVHAPGRNISIARNACLDACSGGWLAFIDDDEVASPGWLKALLAVSKGAAAVFGPAQAIYPQGCPEWMVKGDFHSISVVRVAGEIRTGYTSNVLINLDHPAVVGRRFDLSLGRSGGEDTRFFDQVFAAGGDLEYAPDAIVTEIVVKGRDSFKWLFKRRFRYGQTHGGLLKAHSGLLGTIGAFALASAKSAFCLGGAALSIASAVGWRRWLLRGALHIGVLASLLGSRDIVQYGQGDPAPSSAS